MKLSFQEIDEVESVAVVYNRLCTHLPYFFSTTPDEFASGMKTQVYEEGPYDGLQDEQFIIAEAAAGDIVGFSHVATAEAERDGKKIREGILRFFSYTPGYRNVGQALLGESETYLIDREVDVIGGLGYGFGYLSWGLRRRTPQSCPHVLALFGMNGYRTFLSKPLMLREGLDVDAPTLPDASVDVAVKHEPGRGVRPHIFIHLTRNGQPVGRCLTYSVGQFSQAEAAQDACYIDLVFLREPERGKGFGRYLLQRSLYEARNLGYKSALLETTSDNYRAQLLYANYGFSILDVTHGCEKLVSSE